MAIFGNLNFLELAVILLVAIMIFGSDLPRVAGQLFAHLSKAKRAMQTMWRETGIDAEMRKVQREMREAEAKARFDPAAIAREATDRWTQDIDIEGEEKAKESDEVEESADPDAWRADEAADDARREGESENGPEEGDQKRA